MSTPAMDPLALLAAQADARARAEFEGNVMSITSETDCNVTKGLPKEDIQNSATSMAQSYRLEIAAGSRSPRQPTPSPTVSPGAASQIPTSTRKQRGQCKRPNFAFTLHAILADKSCKSAITWLPSGKSFVILDRGVFTKQILPRYLRETRFESFSRRLKRWNFKKIFLSGQSQAVYSHDLFQRDRLDLCKLMNGNGNSGTNYDISKPELSKNCTTDKEISELKQLTEQAQVAGPKFSRVKRVKSQAKPSYLLASSTVSKTVNHKATANAVSALVPHAMSSETQLMNSTPCYKTVDAAGPDASVLPRALHQAPYIPPNSIGLSGPIHSRYAAAYHSSTSDEDSSYHAAQELLYIDRDIARCEEQLAVLRHLRALKQKRYLGNYH